MGFLDERKVNESLMTTLMNGGKYNSLLIYANNEFAKMSFKNSADYFPVLCGEDHDLTGLFALISEYSTYDHKGKSFDYSYEAALLRDILRHIDEYKHVFEKQYNDLSLVVDKELNSGSEKKQNNRKDDLRLLGVCARIINKGYLLLYIYLILQYLIPGYMELPDESKDRIIYAPASKNDDENYRADLMPLFTHFACMSDIKNTAVKASPNLIGISNVARLYHHRIACMMADNDKANVWVKLWKDEGEGLSPVYVKVNKVKTFVVWNTKYSDEILWVGVLREALKYSGMDFESMTPAEVVYHCFGPEFEVSDATQLVEEYKNHKINNEELLAYLSECVECGYPITATSSSEYYCILGAYQDERSGNYLVNLYNPAHEANAFTAEFSEFFNSCTRLELNKSEAIKEEAAFREKGIDVLSNKTCVEYTKCFQDIYLSLISTDSMYEDESKEFLDLIAAARDSIICMVWSLGCDRRSFSPYLAYLRESIKSYEESIRGLSGNKEKARHDICGILNRILDIFETPGEEGLYPLTIFLREFSLRFSEKLLKTSGKQFDAEDIKQVSEELMNEEAFLKLVSSKNIVELCKMNETQMEPLVIKYIASKNR